jgi:hypothetical protein
VRVRPEHGRHAPVEHACERNLLARRLGVEVDDDDRRERARPLHDLVDDLKRMHGHLEEERAHEVDDGDAAGLRDAGPRRCGAEVGRPEDAGTLAFEEREEVAMTPDVVSGRDDVGTRGEELLGELRGQADPVGRVLSVDDAGIGAQLLSQAGEPLLDRAAAGGAEDVG